MNTDIVSLYKRSYCAKEAGIARDIINFIRQLLGLPYKNTRGDNLATFGVGAGTAGLSGYAAYKSFINPSLRNQISARYPDLIRKYEDFYKNNSSQFPNINDSNRRQFSIQAAKSELKPLTDKWNSSTSKKLYNSGLGKFLRKSLVGRYAAIPAAALAIGSLSAGIYDTLVNDY